MWAWIQKATQQTGHGTQWRLGGSWLWMGLYLSPTHKGGQKGEHFNNVVHDTIVLCKSRRYVLRDIILSTKQTVPYRSTVWPNRWWAGIWTIIKFQIVVLAVSRVINANLVECNHHNSSTGCPNTPLTVSAIWIGSRVIWTGKGAVVSIQPTTTTWGGKYRKLKLLE